MRDISQLLIIYCGADRLQPRSRVPTLRTEDILVGGARRAASAAEPSRPAGFWTLSTRVVSGMEAPSLRSPSEHMTLMEPGPFLKDLNPLFSFSSPVFHWKHVI